MISNYMTFSSITGTGDARTSCWRGPGVPLKLTTCTTDVRGECAITVQTGAWCKLPPRACPWPICTFRNSPLLLRPVILKNNASHLGKETTTNFLEVRDMQLSDHCMKQLSDSQGWCWSWDSLISGNSKTAIVLSRAGVNARSTGISFSG